MHSNRVCLLSPEELIGLRDWGRRPNCRQHQHEERGTVDDMVRAGDLEYLQAPGPRRAFFKVQYTLQKVYKRYGLANIHALAPNGRRSQLGPGEPIMQLVRGAR